MVKTAQKKAVMLYYGALKKECLTFLVQCSLDYFCSIEDSDFKKHNSRFIIQNSSFT